MGFVVLCVAGSSGSSRRAQLAVYVAACAQAVAENCLLVNAWEAEVGRILGKPDVSQRGNYEMLRNEERASASLWSLSLVATQVPSRRCRNRTYSRK